MKTLIVLIACLLILFTYKAANEDNPYTLSALLFSFLGIVVICFNIKYGFLFVLLFHLFCPFIERIIFYYYPEMPFPNYLGISANFLTFFLIVRLFISKILSKERLFTNSLDRWVFLYILLIIFQVFNPNSSVIIGVYGLRSIILVVAIYFCSEKIFTDEKDIRLFLRVFTIYGICALSYGFYQHFFGLTVFENVWIEGTNATSAVWFDQESTVWSPRGYYKIFSFTGGNYEFFYPLSILSIFLIALRRYIKGMDRLFMHLFLVLYFGLLVLELERAPIAMTIIGLIIVFILQPRLELILKRLALAVPVLCCLFILFLLSATKLKPLESSRVTRFAELSNPLEAETIISRMDRHWKPMLKVVGKNLFGMGTGTATYTRVMERRGLYGATTAPHSIYLYVLYEQGIIGLIIFLVIIIKVIGSGVNFIFNTSDRFLRMAAKAALGIVIALLANGIVNMGPFLATSGTLFWLCAGLIPRLKNVELQAAKAL
jgi:hypothetical protein